MTQAIAIAVACTLIFPGGVAAQPSLPDLANWSTVLGHQPDAPIKVVTRDGRTIIGSIEGVSADALVIDKRWGRNETVSRDDVFEIRTRHGRSTAAYLGIGALSGLAGGAAVGRMLACHNGPCTGEDRAMGTWLTGMFGMSMGSIIGVSVGAVRNLRRGRVIYRAPASTTMRRDDR